MTINGRQTAGQIVRVTRYYHGSREILIEGS